MRPAACRLCCSARQLPHLSCATCPALFCWVQVRIGRPGYRVTKQFDPDSGSRGLLFQVGLCVFTVSLLGGLFMLQVFFVCGDAVFCGLHFAKGCLWPLTAAVWACCSNWAASCHLRLTCVYYSAQHLPYRPAFQLAGCYFSSTADLLFLLPAYLPD